ncbi:uncharacterized protein LOC114828002 [Galendromus occidentalis]|uniref:Uncharacterized protein LOC114828002 n=1 Tax=Galendromus occidentalis TaxID=34638 RepID=A0AAJ7SEC5_9ACAR|nr:uncharacterized protein LOC114828002 [Galendromus occidentalis]
MFGSSLNYGAGPSGTNNENNQNPTDPYHQTPYGQQLFLQQPVQVYAQQAYNVLPPPNGAQQILSEHFVFDESLPNHLQLGSGIEDLNVAAGKNGAPSKKNRNASAKLLACETCTKEFRHRSTLRKHIITAHREDTRSLPSFWCNETNCDFQCDCVDALLKHLREGHGRQMEALKMSFASFSDFYSWKNHLEESERVKFLLSKGEIVEGENSTVFHYQCHRAQGLTEPSCRVPPLDVMEKALQEILPQNRDVGNVAHRLEIVDDDEIESTDSRRSIRRMQNSSPCVAHMRVTVSQTSGNVEVAGCRTHYGHELDRVPRPPDCVLGKLRQQMQKLSRTEIEAQLSSWTKHDLTQTTWKNLENQSPSTCTLFAQFRSLLKRTYEHIAVITRTNGQYYWMDPMECLADLFQAEHKLKNIRERMTSKVRAAGCAPFESNSVGMDLCYSLLSFANDRDQLKKLLKHGLDYADDARSTDVRYSTNFSSLANSTVYDPSVVLFKSIPGALSLPELSLDRLRASMTKRNSPVKKQKYARQLVGSEDDSEYDCWSDDEIVDVVPRRWQPVTTAKQGTLEGRRIEKNMKRKIVPALDIKPELREKILAMRIEKDRDSLETEEIARPRRTAARQEQRRNPRRKAKRSRRARRGSPPEDTSDDGSDPDKTPPQEPDGEGSPPAQEIVLRELRVEGPAGKQARKARVLASENDQEVSAIVIEPPTPRPEVPQEEPKVLSLLKPSTSLLMKPSSGQSLLKSGAISLLKPRCPPKPPELREWKAAARAVPREVHDRTSIDFDEGPLQTPQPPRIED